MNRQLGNGGDARQRQEEAELLGKFEIGAGEDIPARQILRLEHVAIGGEDELGLGLRGGGAVAKGGEGLRDLARRGCSDVDVVTLKNAAQIGLVGVARPQPLDLGRLAPKRLQKGVGEFCRVKRLLRQNLNGFSDFCGVHWAESFVIQGFRQLFGATNCQCGWKRPS